MDRQATWMVVTAIAATGAILVGSVVWYEYQPGGAFDPIVTLQVDVTQVVWTYFGAPEASSPGFNVEAGTPVSVSLNLYCPNGSGFFGPVPQNCSSGSVFIETPGFGLASTNAPFVWSSGTAGAYHQLDARLATPAQDYSGNLTIELH